MNEGASMVIVGPGRMGLALGYALIQADAVQHLTVCGRRPEPPNHPLFTQGLARYVYGMEAPAPDTDAVFLAVPDDALPEIAHSLAARGPAPERAAVFHMSGTLGTDVLAPLHAVGYAVGVFHAVQVITHPVTGAERLPGSYVMVTGSPTATAVARRLASAMGSPVLQIPEARRSQCHGAMTMVAGYLPPLLDAATRVFESAGVPTEDALAALVRLVKGTLTDIQRLGPEHVVAGVVASDPETVSVHLRALEPEYRRVYAAIGTEMMRLAGASLPDDIRSRINERLVEQLVD